jgi:hypothetical protein
MASIWGFLNNPVKDVQKTLQVAEDLKKADRAERLELYKLMVEMADRVSQRRQVANSFYLSINTLLVGGSAYLGTTTASARTTLLISIAGVLVCTYWVKAIESYKTLNTAKFSIINEIETSLVIKPFTDEWSRLDPDGDGKRHKPFHETEKFVPRVFVGMYAFQVIALIPWGSIWQWFFSKAC